jgi:hypothetical protein
VRGSSAISGASTHAVASHYFEVRGRLRLDGAVVEERSLVFKQRVPPVARARRPERPGRHRTGP